MAKRTGSALITVRLGNTITAVHDEALATQHLESLSSGSCKHLAPSDAESNLHTVADEAATTVLGWLVNTVPLHGRALTSLSAALRVREVRSLIGPNSEL